MASNILFIMCDQLRWDYLSCYGHSSLRTPNIDSLAADGVRFDNAYCQSPLCGPSRASYYTGRYTSSHGVMDNEDKTRIDEMTLADYLRPQGYRSALVGKTHNRKDIDALKALGVDPNSDLVRGAGSGGFEPFELHEGIYPDDAVAHDLPYNNFLRSQGYSADNPWHEFANSGQDEQGLLRSGWSLRNSHYPAQVEAEHSETAYLTTRAIDFLDQQDSEQPWCLHLSYIKPHWPLIAPAPYHNLFNSDDIQPVLRSESERQDTHPVVDAFMQQEYSQSYSRHETRERVIPAYMGLIKEVDDQLGRLFDYLKSRSLYDNTLILFTSDHGDYLGDHWLGEKDLFHEPSVKVPLIIVNPSTEADQTRGTVSKALVEAIDLLPTMVAFSGAELTRERIEGRSLIPLLHSKGGPNEVPDDWRDYAVSEIDYSDRGVRRLLDIPPYDCRAVMIRSKRWKYIHYNRFRPQLFDLARDPDELHDLGEDPTYAQQRSEMQQCLIEWRSQLKPRVGMPYAKLADMGPVRDEQSGVIIGRW